MIKRLSLFIVCVLFAASLLAQVIQKGVVVELSSGNKPLAGVEILVAGATPTVSDANGAFKIYLPDATTGDPLSINRIYKKGYEIVNEMEVKTRSLSSSVPLKVVLCKSGLLEEARRKYYEIGEDLYYREYLNLASELKKEQQKGNLNRKEYEQQLMKLKEELYESMEKLYYYADLFAHINKDELSEIDVRAFALLEAGKVDEAILVYEESGLVEEFHQKADNYLSIEKNEPK